jgi:hypothetical protein
MGSLLNGGSSTKRIGSTLMLPPAEPAVRPAIFREVPGRYSGFEILIACHSAERDEALERGGLEIVVLTRGSEDSDPSLSGGESGANRAHGRPQSGATSQLRNIGRQTGRLCVASAGFALCVRI